MRTITSFAIAGFAGSALVLGGAAVPAQAKINPVGGIGKVKLNNTISQVKKKLGDPDKKYSQKQEIPAGTNKYFEYGADGYYYTVQFFQKSVFSVTTANPKQKTDEGAGPGMTRKALKATYGNTLTRITSKLFELGDRMPGEVITIFRIGSDKKVSTVQVSKYTGE